MCTCVLCVWVSLWLWVDACLCVVRVWAGRMHACVWVWVWVDACLCVGLGVGECVLVRESVCGLWVWVHACLRVDVYVCG